MKDAVALPIVNLAATARLSDHPGGMDKAIERAVLDASVQLTRKAEASRVVLFQGDAQVQIEVRVEVRGAWVKDELDIEDVRHYVASFPQDRAAVLYNPPATRAWE